MKLGSFKELFMFLMADIHRIEEMTLDLLPKMIKKAYSNDLKEALENHLEETKDQLHRLEGVFTAQQEPKVEWENPLKNLFDLAEKFLDENTPSPLLDAAIIAIAQRLEHFEIATYGTLKAYAKMGELSELTHLLKTTLKEEEKADTLLSKLATGGFFSTGINQQAAQQ